MENFDVIKNQNSLVVVLSSQFTALQISDLKELLKKEIAEGVCEVIFDFKLTQNIDSMAIGLLIGTKNSLDKVLGKIRLINVKDDFVRLFKSLRLNEQLAVNTVSGS